MNFGLISQLTETRITLPLTHIETRFRVTGEFAAVEIDQVFEQTAREPLDVTYTFPLPGEAAVYRCEMIINDRLIRARVMEEQEARRTVAKKKAAGHRTALVEMDRENLFTLQLGNTTPGDRIIIRFAYFEKLDRLGSSLSLRVPFCPGVRYIPGQPLLRKNRGLGSEDDTDQVPDASRLSPPRISAEHPDAATMYLHGELDADEVQLTTVSSPTHPAIIRPAESVLEVELAGEQHVPDRDFILRWDETAPDTAKPKAWITADESGRHALLQLRAPLVKQTAAASDDFAQDIYFLLDRSGSMEGRNWKQAAVALHAFVRQLGAKDRVWLTCFESTYQDFSDAPTLRDEILADTGFQNLASLGTGGGTELLPALQHVLEKRSHHSSARPTRIILITDGQVGNEDRILSIMREPEHKGVPVYCFGIDEAVNDAFLKSLARITRGRCALMTPDDDIPAAVEKLAHALRRPVLTNICVQTDGVGTPDDTHSLPDLGAGEVIILPAHIPSSSAKEIRLTGTLPDGSAHSVVWGLGSSQCHADNPIPRLLWAHRRIRHLLEAERKAEAIALAITHNLACRGASFVAWDESEKVSLAKREVYQPSLGRGLCAMPSRRVGTTGRVAHYFESKVVDYQSASILRECSDDELIEDHPATLNGPSYSLAYAPVASRRWEEPEDSGPVLPRPVRKLYDQFMDAYQLRWLDSSDTSEPLMAWVNPFSKLLTERTGTPESVARVIALILRHWALKTISTSRQLTLESWLPSLEAAPDFLSSLRHHFATLADDEAISDATKLLDTALANPPKKKRSWFRKKL